MPNQLWTTGIQDLSRDILSLMADIVEPARTCFFASTMGDRFQLLEFVDRAGLDIDPHLDIPLEQTYCGIIYRDQLASLVIPDAEADPKVASLVITAKSHIGSYLGVPIRLPDGSMFGTLCTIDSLAIQYEERQREAIITLARIMERALESEYLARRDRLSGVFNRLYWDELRVEKRDERSRVLLFDIDDFKAINDTFGHDEGNAAIQQFGRALNKVFYMGDRIRLGGDEFCVVLTGGYCDEAEDLYHQLVDELSHEREGLSVSCGICGDGNDLHALLTRADGAMYEAKRRGKGQCVVVHVESPI